MAARALHVGGVLAADDGHPGALAQCVFDRVVEDVGDGHRLALALETRRRSRQAAAARHAISRLLGVVVHQQGADLALRQRAQSRLDAAHRPATGLESFQLADGVGGVGLGRFGPELHRAGRISAGVTCLGARRSTPITLSRASVARCGMMASASTPMPPTIRPSKARRRIARAISSAMRA